MRSSDSHADSQGNGNHVLSGQRQARLKSHDFARKFGDAFASGTGWRGAPAIYPPPVRQKAGSPTGEPAIRSSFRVPNVQRMAIKASPRSPLQGCSVSTEPGAPLSAWP